ncbi:hypothetical protein YC2023_009784 [Brassica napus]
MSTKRKRSGKGVVEGTAPLVNERLPLRLFATDRYPSNRNNCYSSLEFLLLVRDVLEGSTEMERRNLSLEDLAAMVAGDTTLSQGKKFRICLIIIVDGVLMPKT